MDTSECLAFFTFGRCVQLRAALRRDPQRSGFVPFALFHEQPRSGLTEIEDLTINRIEVVVLATRDALDERFVETAAERIIHLIVLMRVTQHVAPLFVKPTDAFHLRDCRDLLHRLPNVDLCRILQPIRAHGVPSTSQLSRRRCNRAP